MWRVLDGRRRGGELRGPPLLLRAVGSHHQLLLGQRHLRVRERRGLRPNCGSGSTCAVDTFNGTYCYANGGSCSYGGSDTWSCIGDQAVDCTGYNTTGTQFSYNCSTAGTTCVDNADPFGDSLCLAPGCTFNDEQNCSESCNGSRATVCVGGAPYTFDCAHIGSFTGCELLTDGLGNPYAVCD